MIKSILLVATGLLAILFNANAFASEPFAYATAAADADSDSGTDSGDWGDDRGDGGGGDTDRTCAASGC